jgi:hypothetical protein
MQASTRTDSLAGEATDMHRFDNSSDRAPSKWASVTAVLAVIGAIGTLYLPLLLG